MSQATIILLCNGGVRSLVATAAVLSWPQQAPVTLLHVKRVQPGKEARTKHARLQAAHFEPCKLIEVEEAKLSVPAGAREIAPRAEQPLSRMRLLAVALAQAALMSAGRIIWPVSFNGDFGATTAAVEQTVLARHMASTEMDDPPFIESPMMELTNRQVVELGAQLGVPWELAWSCDIDGERACGACSGCRRRKAAFESVGIDDPTMATV